jgi:hypothetical protein
MTLSGYALLFNQKNGIVVSIDDCGKYRCGAAVAGERKILK